MSNHLNFTTPSFKEKEWSSGLLETLFSLSVLDITTILGITITLLWFHL